VFAYQSKEFSCHLRYGYLQWKSLVGVFDSMLGTWTLGSMLVLDMLIPFSFVWVTVAALFAWHYVLLQHREAIRQVSLEVEKFCLQGKVALDHSRKCITTVSEYEKQALGTAEKACRDSRLAQGVKATDFFDMSNQAWAALSQVAGPIDGMTKEANEVLERSRTIKEDDIQRRDAIQQGVDTGEDESDEGDSEDEEYQTIADDMVTEAEKAVGSCRKADELLKDALKNLRDCQKAKDQAEQAREIETKNAQGAVNSAQKLTNHVKIMSADLPKAIDAFEKMNWEAEKAKTLATQGEMELARLAAMATGEYLKKVKYAANSVAQNLDVASSLLLNVQLGQ
jgi:uncharacterized protein YoxC